MENMLLKNNRRPESSRRGGWSGLCWAVLILLALSLAACRTATPENPSSTEAGSPSSPASVDPQNPNSEGEATPAEDAGSAGTAVPDNQPPETASSEKESPEQIQGKWETSPHAHTYVLDSAGNNITCARCHAPVNWIPSMDDMPESCYACKFEVKPAPPLIDESNWTHVECKICHEVKKKEVQPEISWLEIAQIEQYAALASASDLCLKCHTPVEVPGHVGVSNAGAHAAMVCSDCHDAHSTTASCSEAGCHESMEIPGAVIAGHDEEHTNVSCSACHDASGLDLGIDETGSWVTFHPSPAEGAAEQVAYTSHNTVREAPCERCHFAENPWGLNLVEASEPSQ